MDLHDVVYFLEIVKEGSLSKAAEKLFISQSALSKYLNKTEQTLGIKLFRRLKNNSLTLTDAGSIYYQCCKDIERLWRSAEQRIQLLKEDKSLHLKIGVVTQKAALLLTKNILELQKTWPQLKVEILTGQPKELQEKVLQGECDLAFIAYNEEHPLLSYHQFSNKEVDLLVPSNHELAQYSHVIKGNEDVRIPLAKIGAEPLALLSKDTVLRQAEDDYFESIRFVPNEKFTLSHTAYTYPFVASGKCFSFEQRSSVEHAGIVPIALTPPFYYKNGACYRKDLLLTPLMKEAIALFSESYCANL